jgi:dUTP pyrophosphatase
MIRRALGTDPPLIRGYRSLEEQLQPNGFDLTLAEVHRHAGAGRIGTTNAERRLSELEPVPFGPDGFVSLAPGAYHIVYNEIVALPLDVMALGRPRSSLNRNGVTIHTAVWDAGYEGRSTSLLQVLNPAGFEVARDARVMQLVFFTLGSATISL